MDDINHLPYSLLKDTMRRRIGNHTTGEHVFVLLGFGFPVREVCVTQFIAFYHTRRESSLHTRSGVRTMCRRGYEKDAALALALALEVLTNDDESGIFACGTGSGL